jgi:ParB family transcriptional regulator, chromosome partitioning protein
MARKNLLSGLTGTRLTAVNPESGGAGDSHAAMSANVHLGGMSTRGAIGAVSRSIEQLKAYSVVEIEPDLIEASFVADRLENSEEHHRSLVESIREHGQQVPVLVRPHPEKEGRFQIAYGRRRVQAIRELGGKVRAIIKTLSDEQLVVAQGQENSARKDLTFIEKALFAARLEQAGYSRETIMAALTVDKTALSRLIASAVKIPADLIEAIGPAPAIGRDRWVALSVRLEATGAMAKARALVDEPGFAGLASDSRFNKLFAAVAPKLTKPPRANALKSNDGSRLGTFKDETRTLTVSIDKKAAGDFAGYLLAKLPDLYASFKRGGTE